MRKGVSPVIASIVLIAITVTLAAVIFSSSKGFFSQSTPVPDCSRVSFEAEIYSPVQNSYSLDVNNYGNEIIEGFNMITVDESLGEVDVKKIDLVVKPGQSTFIALPAEIKNIDPGLSPAVDETGAQEETEIQQSVKDVFLIPIIKNSEGIAVPCSDSFAVKIN